jgi:hypothetical protein
MAWLVLVFGWSLVGPAFGDNTTIVLKDGSLVKGEIKKMDARAVEVSGSVGDITIAMDKVEKIESEAGPAAAATEEKSAKQPRPQMAVLEQAVDPKPENFRQGAVLYDDDSIYNHRFFGLGLAVGELTGFGLSALFRVSPVTLVVTGVPFSNGYDAGAQLQCDVFTRGSRRIYLCAGVSHYKTGEDYNRGMGMGGGFGWMAAKLVGFSGNIGLAQGNALGFTDMASTASSTSPDDSFHLNLNFMLHFYVL